MKKSAFILALTLLIFGISVQKIQAQKFIDRNGTLIFEASEELFEPVKASNEAVTMLLDINTNEIAALALMKGFRFKNSLMEEHFNENYIESETYPKATFKGKLLDFDTANLSTENTEIMVEGTLKLHGKEKEIRTPLTVKKYEDIIWITGSFKVTPQDFDISIPKIVQNKIAKQIIIDLEFKLSKK